MSKLRIISTEKHINYVSGGNSLQYDKWNQLFRPQTKEAYIIANDAVLEGK